MAHYRKVEAAYMAINPLRSGRSSIVPRLHETLKAFLSLLTWSVLHALSLVCLLSEALAIFSPSSTRDHIHGFFVCFSLTRIHTIFVISSGGYRIFQSDQYSSMYCARRMCMRWEGCFLFQFNRNTSMWYILWLSLCTTTWRSISASPMSPCCWLIFYPIQPTTTWSSTSARVLCLHAVDFFPVQLKLFNMIYFVALVLSYNVKI
jgi:hypothetical protein